MAGLPRYWPRTLANLAAICFVASTGTLRCQAAEDWLSGRMFPMKVGHEWVYAFDEQEVTFEVVGKETAEGSELFVVRRTIGETSVDFKLAVEDHGVYIHQEGETEFAPPLRQFAFFARTGDTWHWRGTSGGERSHETFEHAGIEEVTVPAGKFTALRIEQSNPDTGDHATYWLAAEVGVVKLTGKSDRLGDDAAEKVLFDWQLKEFKPAP